MTLSLPMEIIGGGLAGLSLGLALQRAGVPVTIYESGHYPRHRVCGEFIAGLSEDTIATLGLEPHLHDALLHHDVAWFSDGRLTNTQTLPSPARALSRHRLDARLAGAFIAAGGRLLTGTRIADADRAVGRVITTGRRRARTPWIGLKIHALDLPTACDLELHLGNQTYLGVTRVEDNRVNLCGLFHRQSLTGHGSSLLLTYLRHSGLAPLADRLAGARFDEESFSAVAGIDFDQRVFVEPGSVSLGDASAMIPPFTGNGMAMAFQSAAVALAPLLAYARAECDWVTANRSIHTALRRRFRTRLATAGWLHPFLLQPPRQRWLTRLAASNLLPLRALYAALH